MGALTRRSRVWTLDGMQTLLEANSLAAGTPAEQLKAASAAGADGLIVDGGPGEPDWKAWGKAGGEAAGAGPRVIGRIAVELPQRGRPGRDWRRVFGLGERPEVILRVRSTDNLDGAYREAIAVLEPMVSELVRLGVHPILEPAGTLARSREVWFIREAMDQAAGPDAISVAWRPLEPALPTDAPSVSIKRLIRSLELVFIPPLPSEANRPKPVEGEGKAWMPLPQNGDDTAGVFVVEQLKGVLYDRMICLSRPRGSSAAVDWAGAVAELRAEWAKAPIPLSAYKGDKNAPKYAKPGTPSTTGEPALGMGT